MALLQTVLGGELAADKFILFYLHPKKLVDAFSVNEPKEVAVVRRLMKSGLGIGEKDLGEPSKRLSEFVEV